LELEIFKKLVWMRTEVPWNQGNAKKQASVQNIAEDIALKSMRPASRAGSQSEALFTRTF
jgi:hypothetical protein